MNLFRLVRHILLLAIAAIALVCVDGRAARAQQLWPDVVPWVREDAPYLVNWDITSSKLRMQTMFANIGDGLLQLRTDLRRHGRRDNSAHSASVQRHRQWPQLSGLLRRKCP